jgi:hypothetical protein
MVVMWEKAVTEAGGARTTGADQADDAEAIGGSSGTAA